MENQLKNHFILKIIVLSSHSLIYRYLPKNVSNAIPYATAASMHASSLKSDEINMFNEGKY